MSDDWFEREDEANDQSIRGAWDLVFGAGFVSTGSGHRRV
jgi:hypothetical protein